MKLVKITWCDAISVNENVWYNYDEVLEWASGSQWVITTVGFLVYQSDDYIVIAGEYSETNKQYARPFKIPAGCILDMKGIKFKRKKKSK